MVNTLGDPSAREKYKEALLTYLKPHFDSLSPESQTRFTKNPLRILDSKDPKEQALLETAPSILDFISPESQKHFDTLCALLQGQNIPFTPAPRLVRGLDYGVKTDPQKALEWYTESAKQGDPAVQYQVGAKYFRGDGVKKNDKEAAKWVHIS